MRNIEQLIEELIPPNNYQHRRDFTNKHIVSTLTKREKIEVERNLTKMLHSKDDVLIGETLALIKSTESLPTLKKRLDLEKKANSKILWAKYINDIKDGDEEMIEIAITEFDNVTDKYSRIQVFYNLAGFSDSRINDKIRSFINHKDYLTAYNARTSLGIDTEEWLKKRQIKNVTLTKKWWEIWK